MSGHLVQGRTYVVCGVSRVDPMIYVSCFELTNLKCIQAWFGSRESIQTIVLILSKVNLSMLDTLTHSRTLSHGVYAFDHWQIMIDALQTVLLPWFRLAIGTVRSHVSRLFSFRKKTKLRMSRVVLDHIQSALFSRQHWRVVSCLFLVFHLFQASWNDSTMTIAMTAPLQIAKAPLETLIWSSHKFFAFYPIEQPSFHSQHEYVQKPPASMSFAYAKFLSGDEGSLCSDVCHESQSQDRAWEAHAWGKYQFREALSHWKHSWFEDIEKPKYRTEVSRVLHKFSVGDHWESRLYRFRLGDILQTSIVGQSDCYLVARWCVQGSDRQKFGLIEDHGFLERVRDYQIVIRVICDSPAMTILYLCGCSSS